LERVALEELQYDRNVFGHHLDAEASVDRLPVPVSPSHDRHRAVAERHAARCEAAVEAASEPAVRVGAELLEILLVHDAHHACADVPELEARARLEGFAPVQT
jgi:hypothetical protein